MNHPQTPVVASASQVNSVLCVHARACVCVRVCAYASGLMKQCHFDGFFHFFRALYESMGKFVGISNKDVCVCLCVSLPRPSRDICGLKKKDLTPVAKGPAATSVPAACQRRNFYWSFWAPQFFVQFFAVFQCLGQKQVSYRWTIAACLCVLSLRVSSSA